MTDASYAPRRRTALVLAGFGTAGAYHAGVLRALHEAGVKVDVVAGRGVGAVGAVLAAVNAGSHLWAARGLWRGGLARDAYRFRPVLRLASWWLAAALVALLSPLLVLGLAAVAYVGVLVAGLAGAEHLASAVARSFRAGLDALFAPGALPVVVPRTAAAALVGLLLTLGAGAVVSAARRRRRVRGAPWWQIVDAPLESDRFARRVTRVLWRVIRGATTRMPVAAEVGRRYAELLGENVGEPGFRELLIVVHDVDARRDLAFAFLREPFRSRFFGGRTADGAPRAAEAFDLGGVARESLVDVLAASLSVPVATSPRPVTFAPECPWRGETHRLADRPGGWLRLFLEVAAAGAEQVIVVSAVPGGGSAHRLEAARVDWRGAAGEYVRAMETVALEDALQVARPWFAGLYVVRPGHNPLGPFDFRGGHDEASDRWCTLDDLVARGYEDAYREFIDPVVGASGEQLAAPGAVSRGSS